MINPSHLYSKAAAARELNIGVMRLECLIRMGNLKTVDANGRRLVTGVSMAQVLGMNLPGVPAPETFDYLTPAAARASFRRSAAI